MIAAASRRQLLSVRATQLHPLHASSHIPTPRVPPPQAPVAARVPACIHLSLLRSLPPSTTSSIINIITTVKPLPLAPQRMRAARARAAQLCSPVTVS